MVVGRGRCEQRGEREREKSVNSQNTWITGGVVILNISRWDAIVGDSPSNEAAKNFTSIGYIK